MIRKWADHEEQRSFLHDSHYPAPTGATTGQLDRKTGDLETKRLSQFV